MAIEFKCPCGAACSAEESKVGQLHHCAVCGLDIPVPPAVPPVLHEPAKMGDLKDQIVSPEAAAAAADEAAKRKASAAALHDQLGRSGGVAEMQEQMKAIRSEAASGGAPLKVDLGPRPARQAPKPPTGVARAAHHISFKRAMWLPALLIGAVCLACAALCMLTMVGVYIYPMRGPQTAPELGIENPQLVKDAGGHWWAMPQGAKPSPDSRGKMFYQNAFGYDDEAKNADEYVRITTANKGSNLGYVYFGAGLAAIGLLLAGLSLWMLSDVRTVDKTYIPVAEEAPAPGSGAPPSPKS